MNCINLTIGIFGGIEWALSVRLIKMEERIRMFTSKLACSHSLSFEVNDYLIIMNGDLPMNVFVKELLRKEFVSVLSGMKSLLRWAEIWDWIVNFGGSRL